MKSYNSLLVFVDKYSAWSNLREIGNSTIVRLSILMPIFGYMILFSPGLAPYYDLSGQFISWDTVLDVVRGESPADSPIKSSYRLYCFYFGLSFIGVASAIFIFRCPPLVRGHGSAWQFVASEERSMTPARLVGMKDLIKQRQYMAKYASSTYSYEELRSKVPAIELSDEQMTQFEELSNELNDFITDVDDTWNTARVMTEYFVPLKYQRIYARSLVFFLYASGFLILIIPTVDTFLLVVLTLVL